MRYDCAVDIEHRAQARARCEAATPGPHQTRFVYRIIYALRQHGLKLGLMMGPDTGKDWQDADLWANSQADITAALDAIDAADKRIAGLEEEVELKQTALNMALVQNVEAMQIVLRNKVEATPAGYYDALTEARSKVAELEAQLLELAAEIHRAVA